MAPGSETPLIKKLGIKPGYRIAFQNEPSGYLSQLGKLPAGVVVAGEGHKQLDFLQVFVTEPDQLEPAFEVAKVRIKPSGMIWVSWPKLTSSLSGELKGGVVREVGLASGLVDVKVAAIDDDWSALKFVYRTEDRPG